MFKRRKGINKGRKAYIVSIVVVIGIFLLTLDTPDATRQLSKKVLVFAVQILDINEENPPRWATDLHWFRSLAHLPEYFILGISIKSCIKAFGSDKLSIKSLGIAIIICVIIAFIDETLKLVLPAREFEGQDLLFDIVGSTTGIAAASIIELLCDYSKRVEHEKCNIRRKK